jgi:hypothetical protein
MLPLHRGQDSSIFCNPPPAKRANVQACLSFNNVTPKHYVRVSKGWTGKFWISYSLFVNRCIVLKRDAPLIKVIVIVHRMTAINATNIILVLDAIPPPGKFATH